MYIDQPMKLIPSSKIENEFAAIREIIFRDESFLEVEAVLTSIKRWQAYSPEYLEKKVNENLGAYLETQMGIAAATLSNKFSWPANEVQVHGASLRFPDGTYGASFSSLEKKHGKLLTEVRIQKEFFSPLEIPNLLHSLCFSPRELTIELAEPLDPLTLADRLRAKNWNLVSQLPHQIEASFKSFQLKIEISRVTLSGFSVEELFHAKEKSIFSSILGLFN